MEFLRRRLFSSPPLLTASCPVLQFELIQVFNEHCMQRFFTLEKIRNCTTPSQLRYVPCIFICKPRTCNFFHCGLTLRWACLCFCSVPHAGGRQRRLQKERPDPAGETSWMAEYDNGESLNFPALCCPSTLSRRFFYNTFSTRNGGGGEIAILVKNVKNDQNTQKVGGNSA